MAVGVGPVHSRAQRRPWLRLPLAASTVAAAHMIDRHEASGQPDDDIFDMFDAFMPLSLHV